MVGVDDFITMVFWRKTILESQVYSIDTYIFMDNHISMLLDNNGRNPVIK